MFTNTGAIRKASVMSALVLSFLANGQKLSQAFQSTPNAVMNELFRAAKDSDYSNLHFLCPPLGGNDGDTQSICEIAKASPEKKAEFNAQFENGYLRGDIRYFYRGRRKFAKVPFWFNHPGGPDRSNEEMLMVKWKRKWYLGSF